MIEVGCCGLGFFSPKELFGSDWNSRFASRLQAYSSLFDVIEVEKTFYKLPREKTLARWRADVDELNKKFEFVPKAPKEITHVSMFADGATEALEKFIAVAKTLHSTKMLFQTPASFGYSKANLDRAKDFFSTIEGYDIIWEPRGDWLISGINGLSEYCADNGVVLCTDPLRIAPDFSQKFYYYRLHGFGKGMMYSYKFSDEELKKVAEIVKKRKETKVYIMFNNSYMYDDALRLKSIL